MGTGIEPVFTDLQSTPNHHSRNDLNQKKYHDKPRTNAERDTPPECRRDDDAGYHSWRGWADHSVQRAVAARSFTEALIECDPDDRLDFLEGAHEVLRAGWPGVPFGSVMDHAAFWADSASRIEHKAYALACYQRMTLEDKRRFKAYIRDLPDE